MSCPTRSSPGEVSAQDSAASRDDSDESGITLTVVEANGIGHRIATAGLNQDVSSSSGSPRRRRRPLVMLLHGWPESWRSWRKQLLFLSAEGYAVCAPDMRGYGGTDSPADLAAYNMHVLAADVACLASVLGYRRFVVVGHDFGSYLAWHVALLHPDRVRAVCGLSVPYVGHSPKQCGPLKALEGKYGKSISSSSRSERLQSKFHYMLHHCLPVVADEYKKNAAEALFRLYAYHPGVECEKDTPEVADKHMFIIPEDGGRKRDDIDLDARCAPGFWARLPKPKQLPSWLSADDLAYYISEFERRGFEGGLKWYEALDMNWDATRYLAGRKVSQPALYIAGDEDGVVRAHGGKYNVRRRMRQSCERLTNFVMLRGAGHWIQQERSNEVNAELLMFLQSLPPDEGVAYSGNETTQSML